MRNRPPYGCTGCGAEQPWGITCIRCGEELLDQEGVPQLAPSRRRVAMPEGAQFLERSAGYRDAPKVLLFDGSPDDRVWIIIPRPAAQA